MEHLLTLEEEQIPSVSIAHSPYITFSETGCQPVTEPGGGIVPDR